MKSSTSMCKFIAIVATNVFPISNYMVSGFAICTVAGSFFARFWLTNDHMLPVSNIPNTVNPWVLIGKYKRPHCILMLLSLDETAFPTYLMSASYISFPTLSLASCLGYSTSLFYYWAVASKKIFTCCTGAHVVHSGNI